MVTKGRSTTHSMSSLQGHPSIIAWLGNIQKRIGSAIWSLLDNAYAWNAVRFNLSFANSIAFVVVLLNVNLLGRQSIYTYRNIVYYDGL